jgi:hypothetical protein
MWLKRIAWSFYAAGTLLWMHSGSLTTKAIAGINFAAEKDLDKITKTLGSVTTQLGQAADWRLLACLVFVAGLLIQFAPRFLKRGSVTPSASIADSPLSNRNRHMRNRWRRWRR